LLGRAGPLRVEFRKENVFLFPFCLKVEFLWDFVKYSFELQKIMKIFVYVFQSVSYLGKILNAKFEYFLHEQQLAQLNVK
jgi:hypothetical protein